MTDFANLAIKVDSTEAGDAARDLGQLTRAGAQAEQAVDKLGATSAQTGNQMRGAGRAAADYAAAAQAAARQTTQVGEAGKLTAFQARNMAFQFQDLGLQLAMAAQSSEPLRMSMMALAMQGPQITAIMSEAGMSAGQLAKQMVTGAGAFLMANPIIAATAAVVGVAAAAIGFMTSEINKNAETQVTWGDTAMGVWDAARAYLSDKLNAAFEYFGTTAEEVWKGVVHVAKWAVNWIIGGMTLIPRAAMAAFSTIGPAIGDGFYSGVNLAIRALNWLIRKAYEAANLSRVAFNFLLPKEFQLPKLTAPQIDEVANEYAGAGKVFGEAMLGALSDTVNRDYIGEAASYISPFAQKRAKDRIAKDAKKGGAEAGRTAGKAAAEAYNDTLGEELAAMQADSMAGLMRQATMREEVWEAQLRGDLDDLNADLIKNQKERTRGAEEEAAAYARMNDQLRELVTQLDQLGGFGRTLGDLGAAVYGIRTGDYSGVRGPAGIILQQLGGISWSKTDANGDRTINRLGEEFSKVLTKVFGENGSFTNLLLNAGVGVATGQVLFGQDNKAAQIGGAIGAVAGSFLPIPGGQFIGSLIGSTIGSMFGKRPRGSGSVSNTGMSTSANDAGVGQSLDSFGLGLQSSLSNIAQQLGGSVGAYSIGIGQYKDYFQVSSSANDPRLGGSYFGKKSSSALYDGQDAGAAMRAAIAGAITQGALQGISAGAQALLKSGKDIEAQLAKALKFQGVFDELKATTDPLGAALDEINKRFTELRAIFAEAGASAEEYAQLEQLLALKRQEAQDQARQAMVDKVRDPIEMQIRLLELLGREEDALAASRLLELAGIKGALQPLQAMIYQLEDARKVIDTFEPLAEDLKKFRNELLGGEGEQSFGYLAAQFRSIAQAAANGDATALANLRGAGSAYLDAARLNAGSDLEYRRALGMVLSGVDKGIFAADAQVDYAQAQIDAINNSADIMERLRADLTTLQTQVVENTGVVARMWQRFEVNGLPVITNADEPIQVQVVPL